MAEFIANTYDMRTIPSAGKDFHVSLQTEAATRCMELLAAEAGHSHYITKLKIRADAAMDVSVGSGDAGKGFVEVIHFGPVSLAANNGKFDWNGPRGMGVKCVSGLSLTMDTVDSGGSMWIEAHGKTCKD